MIAWRFRVVFVKGVVFVVFYATNFDYFDAVERLFEVFGVGWQSV